MTPRTVMYSLSAQQKVSQVLEAGVPSFSRIPIVDDGDTDEVVGIVHRRDIFSALAGGREDTLIQDLARPADFVPETLTLDRVLRRFLESRQHLFIVIDEYGGLNGVVSLEDVLEELIGREIVDETDMVTDLRELARRRRRQAMGNVE